MLRNKSSQKLSLFFLLTVIMGTFPAHAGNITVTCDETHCEMSPTTNEALFGPLELPHYDMKPLDTTRRKITIIIEGEDSCPLYLQRADPISEVYNSPLANSGTPSLFTKLFTVIKDSGGDILGFSDGRDAGSLYSMQDLIDGVPHYIGTYPSGTSIIDWIVTFDPDAGNEYQDAQVVFDFDMYFECGEDGDRQALFIDKTNDKLGIVQEPGDSVVYTITVTAGDFEPVFNVQVFDLPPGGFGYVGGSWTAHSDVRGNIKGTVTTEPTYASPGQWNLGDMQPGEVVTLTYKTNISNSQESGLYPDLAWTYGNQADSSSSPLVYGNDATGIFVGTHAEVDVAPEFDVEVEVETEEIEEELEGEVLGSAIELPATGMSVFWLSASFLGLIFGYLITKNGMLISKVSLFVVFMFLFGRMPVYAQVISVRLQEPESPNSQENFYLNYVALDVLDRPIDVKCYKKSPSSATFTQIGTTKTTIPGGDDGYCYVTSGMLPDDGVYQFYVTAEAGLDNDTSSIVSVDYDSDKPGKPKWIVKEKNGSCKYDVEFKTADDGGDTVEVRVFRSTEKEFDANPSTEIRVVAIGSDQRHDFTDDKPNCGKTYYYAVQAFDSAGNGSSVRAETVEKTVTKTVTGDEEAIVTPTVVTEATYVSPFGDLLEPGDEVTGEGDDVVDETDVEVEEVAIAGSTDEVEEGVVLGETTESKLRKLIRFWPIVLLLGVIFYFYAKRKDKE